MNNFGERNRGFSRRGPRKPVPIEEGKEYEVIVEGIGSKGDGIARYQGFVIVVPGVETGDKVKVKVDAVRGKVSFGTVVENLGKASPEEMPVTEPRDSDDSDDSEEAPSDEADEAPEAEEEKKAEEAEEEPAEESSEATDEKEDEKEEEKEDEKEEEKKE